MVVAMQVPLLYNPVLSYFRVSYSGIILLMEKFQPGLQVPHHDQTTLIHDMCFVFYQKFHFPNVGTFIKKKNPFL